MFVWLNEVWNYLPLPEIIKFVINLGDEHEIAQMDDHH